MATRSSDPARMAALEALLVAAKAWAAEMIVGEDGPKTATGRLILATRAVPERSNG